MRVTGWIKAGIAVLPVGLAVVIYLEGRHGDPAYVEPPAPVGAVTTLPAAIGEWQLQDSESFPLERIFEKINGKLQYYEQYGVQHLYSGTWTRDDVHWDVYCYRFGDAASAAGALAGERPPQAVPLEVLHGYRVPGMIAAAGGDLYVQLVARDPTADPAEIREVLEGILPSVTEIASAEQALMPAGLAGAQAVPGSESMIPENAFGHAALSQVRIVSVSLAEGRALWFRATGGQDALNAFAAELSSYGAQDRFSVNGVHGGNMFGAWEVAGVIDDVLWGVVQAPSRAALDAHWNQLSGRLNESVAADGAAEEQQ